MKSIISQVQYNSKLSGTNIQPIRSIDSEVEALANLAAADSHGNIRLLVVEFRSGENRFDRCGEALFGAYYYGHLVGIGGLNIDPYDSRNQIGRVRRLFVDPAKRRIGVGRLLMQQIESTAVGVFPVLQLFTTSPEASTFYESLGYVRQSRYKVSHAKKLTT